MIDPQRTYRETNIPLTKNTSIMQNSELLNSITSKAIMLQNTHTKTIDSVKLPGHDKESIINGLKKMNNWMNELKKNLEDEEPQQ